MARLTECRACGGLVPRTRARCPHCGRYTALPGMLGGIAAAVGLGATLAGATACFELPPGPGDQGGGEEDAGFCCVADYGIAILPDGGFPHAVEPDAGDEDAGMAPAADYGIVILPDGGR